MIDWYGMLAFAVMVALRLVGRLGHLVLQALRAGLERRVVVVRRAVGVFIPTATPEPGPWQPSPMRCRRPRR
jgi:hypothetical protein